MKLNVGCGKDIRAGYINADKYPVRGMSLEMDVTKQFPFADESFDEIVFQDAMEHLIDSPLFVLREFHRVLKPNGVAIVRVPFEHHLGATAGDHIRRFNQYSFDCFRPEVAREHENTAAFWDKDEPMFDITWKSTSLIINAIKDRILFGKHIGYILVAQVYMRFFSRMFPFKYITFTFRKL